MWTIGPGTVSTSSEGGKEEVTQSKCSPSRRVIEGAHGVGLGVAIGAAIGLPLALLLGWNLALGIAVGVGLGIVLGAAFDANPGFESGPHAPESHHVRAISVDTTGCRSGQEHA